MDIEQATGGRLPRFLAGTGALALWAVVGVFAFDPSETGFVGAAGRLTGAAHADEAGVRPPRPRPVLFRFRPGDATLLMSENGYGGEAMEQANAMAMNQVFDLLARSASLPVDFVWTGPGGALARQRARSVEIALAVYALNYNMALPKDPWRVRGAAPPAGWDFGDVLELRLEARVPNATCPRWTEVLDPTLPPGPDTAAVPVSLFVAGGQLSVDRASVWREMPAPGRTGVASPWRHLPAAGMTTPSGQARDIGTAEARPPGSLVLPGAACDVRLNVRH